MEVPQHRFCCILVALIVLVVLVLVLLVVVQYAKLDAWYDDLCGGCCLNEKEEERQSEAFWFLVQQKDKQCRHCFLLHLVALMLAVVLLAVAFVEHAHRKKQR